MKSLIVLVFVTFLSGCSSSRSSSHCSVFLPPGELERRGILLSREMYTVEWQSFQCIGKDSNTNISVSESNIVCAAVANMLVSNARVSPAYKMLRLEIYPSALRMLDGQAFILSGIVQCLRKDIAEKDIPPLEVYQNEPFYDQWISYKNDFECNLVGTLYMWGGRGDKKWKVDIEGRDKGVIEFKWL